MDERPGPLGSGFSYGQGLYSIRGFSFLRPLTRPLSPGKGAREHEAATQLLPLPPCGFLCEKGILNGFVM